MSQCDFKQIPLRAIIPEIAAEYDELVSSSFSMSTLKNRRSPKSPPRKRKRAFFGNGNPVSVFASSERRRTRCQAADSPTPISLYILDMSLVSRGPFSLRSSTTDGILPVICHTALFIIYTTIWPVKFIVSFMREKIQ